jgi:hypothetical protein
MLAGPKSSSHCQNWQEGEGARMTGSGRSTSCVAASGRRSMKGDLFVLTVLRHGSGSLLLRAKGATSLRTEPDNNSPMRRPLFPPKQAQMPRLGHLCACGPACLLVCVGPSPSVCLTTGIRGTGTVVANVGYRGQFHPFKLSFLFSVV